VDHSYGDITKHCHLLGGSAGQARLVVDVVPRDHSLGPRRPRLADREDEVCVKRAHQETQYLLAI
jgi:hypothetical protein